MIDRIFRFLSGTEYDIFISYKRGEADAYGVSLASLLTKNKFRCYFDQYVREEGQDTLPESIRTAVKHSRMLVILGTDGSGASPWMAQEIETYLSRKKRNVVPIDFGNASKQAWFEKANKFYLQKEPSQKLLDGEPSTQITEIIINSFNYRKRNEILQIQALLLIALVAISLLAGAFFAERIVARAVTDKKDAIAIKDATLKENEKIKIQTKALKVEADKARTEADAQRDRAIKEKTTGDINFYSSKLQQDYLYQRYKDAEDDLLKIAAIDSNSQRSFDLFKLGVNECLDNNAYPESIRHIVNAQKLYERKFPEQFRNLHSAFLLRAARLLLEDKSDTDMDNGIHKHALLGCLLNKIRSNPLFVDSVNQILTYNEYLYVKWPDASAWSDYIYLGISPVCEKMCCRVRDSLYVYDFKGNALTRFYGKDYYGGNGNYPFSNAMQAVFGRTDSNFVFVYYITRVWNEPTQFDVDVYSKTRLIKKIHAPVWVLNNTIFNLQDSLPASGPSDRLLDIYVDSYSRDTIYLKRFAKKQHALHVAPVKGDSDVNIYSVRASNGRYIRYRNNDYGSHYGKLELIDTKLNTFQILDSHYYYWYDGFYSADSSLLLMYSGDQDGCFMFDRQMNLLGTLNGCNEVVIALDNSRIIDQGSMRIWLTDRNKIFKDVPWDAMIPTEEKLKLGIEFK